MTLVAKIAIHNGTIYSQVCLIKYELDRAMIIIFKTHHFQLCFLYKATAGKHMVKIVIKTLLNLNYNIFHIIDYIKN